jgi:hypothetical protein
MKWSAERRGNRDRAFEPAAPEAFSLGPSAAIVCWPETTRNCCCTGAIDHDIQHRRHDLCQHVRPKLADWHGWTRGSPGLVTKLLTDATDASLRLEECREIAGSTASRKQD